MKKLVVFFSLMLISSVGFSGDIFKKTGEVFDGINPFSDDVQTNSDGCPVYDNTPIAKVERKAFDFEARWNFLDMPKQGEEGFNMFRNLDFVLTHNLSRSFFVYALYGSKEYDKTEYLDSAFGSKWEAQYIFAGVGVYLNPTFKLFGGIAPYFDFKDEDNNKPKLDTPIEYGASYDIPVYNNKLVLSLRQVRAPQKTEGTNISESQGDAGFTTVSVSYSMPIGW